MSPPFADISLAPYHSGNAVVDVVLFVVFAYVFGLAFTWGARTAGKIP